MSTTWNNWADTIDFTVLELDDPVTLAELKTAVAGAAAAGVKVRVVGSGHSWSLGAVPGTEPYVPGFATGQHLIDISDMHPVNCAQDAYLKATYFEAGGENLVAIPPGTTQGWLATNAANAPALIVLPPYNGYDPDHKYSNQHDDLAVQSAGPAPDITLGGFIANGCHGTGWANPTVADLVQAIEVVVWDGSTASTRSYAISEAVKTACDSNGVFESSPTVDPEAISAMRCSLGALGAISKMVLKLVPAFNVAHINEYVSNDVLFQASYLEQLVTSTDYVEIFWFPFNDESWVMRYSKADPPNKPVQNEDQLGLFSVLNSVLAKLTGNKLGEFLEDFPFLTPLTMNALWAAMKRFPGMRELQDVDFWTDFNAPGQTQVIAPLVDGVSLPARILHQPHRPVLHGSDSLRWKMVATTSPASSRPGTRPSPRSTECRAKRASIRSISTSMCGSSRIPKPIWRRPCGMTTPPTLVISSSSASARRHRPIRNMPKSSARSGATWAGSPIGRRFFSTSATASASHTPSWILAGRWRPSSHRSLRMIPPGCSNNDFLNQLLRGQSSKKEVVKPMKVKAASKQQQGPFPSKRFRFESAEAWAETKKRFGGRGVSQSGAGTLYLQEDGNGALLDSREQIHPLRTSFDAKTNRATFTLLTSSKFFSPGELFGAIRCHSPGRLVLQNLS